MKDQYSKGLVCRSRNLFRIQLLGMKQKAKQERAHAATRASPIAGKMVDLAFWCDYMGVHGTQEHETHVDTRPRQLGVISAQPNR